MLLFDKIRRLWLLSFPEKVQSIAELYWLVKSRCYYRYFLGHLGKHSKLIAPLRVRNLQFVYLGERVLINRHAFLLTLQLDGQQAPRLVFEDDCVIGHFNHITCVREVRIGKKVLTADRVYISDHSHNYSNFRVPIVDQSVKSRGPVSIGEGTWIGENAVILSCNIGKNCVIGANAVVIRDIPDYSVAAGNPARIIRRYDPESNSWKPTNP